MIPSLSKLATPRTDVAPSSIIKEEAGRKNDEGKLRFDLIEAEFEEQLAKAITFGAKEYGANNWQHVEDPINRYYAALRRHLNAWRKGEKVDKDSGLNHLAHVAANVMFLMHFECSGDKE